MTEGALMTYRRYVRPFAKAYGEIIEGFYQEYIKPLEKKLEGETENTVKEGVKVTKIE